jgi:hypothetical protein
VLGCICRAGADGAATHVLPWFLCCVQVAVKRVKPGALKLFTQLKLFTTEAEISESGTCTVPSLPYQLPLLWPCLLS